MQAIETTYRSYKFRSRLEARWALLFDHVGIEWYYEHEGYETPQGRYLPDFWLPKAYMRGHKTPGVLFEVKPENYGVDHPQLAYVGRKLGVGGILAVGFRLDGRHWDELYQVAGDWDNSMFFYVCPACKTVRFDFSGSWSNWKCDHCGDDGGDVSADIVKEAYDAALRYRFW